MRIERCINNCWRPSMRSVEALTRSNLVLLEATTQTSISQSRQATLSKWKHRFQYLIKTRRMRILLNNQKNWKKLRISWNRFKRQIGFWVKQLASRRVEVMRWRLKSRNIRRIPNALSIVFRANANSATPFTQQRSFWFTPKTVRRISIVSVERISSR